VIGNCLPYLLGPEAWLNAAPAELGLRENGIDWKQVVHMYVAAKESARRLTQDGRRSEANGARARVASAATTDEA